jgi:hypothetical protein
MGDNSDHKIIAVSARPACHDAHFMNKFRKLGLIDYNGHIEVHNSLLSAVLHDKPQLKEND